MQVPPKENPVWSALVSGQKTVDLTFLAAKILLARLRLAAQKNPSAVAGGAAELWELYTRNAQLPSAQKDIASLIS